MKYLQNIAIFLVGIIVQWVFSNYFSLFGLAPHVLLILTIAVAAGGGAVLGESLGFFLGIFLDVMAPHLFRANAFALTLTGYLVRIWRPQIDLSNPLSQAL